jgi:hypothetical protein
VPILTLKCEDGVYVISLGDHHCIVRAPVVKNIEAAINNVRGMYFEDKHPGKYLEMVKAKTHAILHDEKMPTEIKELWAEYDELHERGG